MDGINQGRAPSDNHQYFENVQYSNLSRLNTLDICIPTQQRHDEQPGQGLWVIYIHGGAWRDPLITSQSFLTTQSLLLQTRSLKISGYVSLNYRLSPYPSHPSCPSKPTDPSRNATHPDHIHDVLLALAYLQTHHRFGTEYLICGHSCGATLAFQAAAQTLDFHAIKGLNLPRDLIIQPPKAVCGVEGIYSIPDLLSRNSHPAYREFTTAAYGSGKEGELKMEEDSPLNFSYGDGDVLWVIAHSKQDGLVEWEQAEDMTRKLQAAGYNRVDLGIGDDVDRGMETRDLSSQEREANEVVLLELEGQHDEVWEKGTELARAIRVTVERMIGR